MEPPPRCSSGDRGGRVACVRHPIRFLRALAVVVTGYGRRPEPAARALITFALACAHSKEISAGLHLRGVLRTLAYPRSLRDVSSARRLGVPRIDRSHL